MPTSSSISAALMCVCWEEKCLIFTRFRSVHWHVIKRVRVKGVKRRTGLECFSQTNVVSWMPIWWWMESNSSLEFSCMRRRHVRGKNRETEQRKEKKYWIFVKVHLTAAKNDAEWRNGLKWCEVCVHSCDIWLLSSFSSSSLKTFLWNEIEHATKTSVFRKKTAVCNKKS